MKIKNLFLIVFIALVGLMLWESLKIKQAKEAEVQIVSTPFPQLGKLENDVYTNSYYSVKFAIPQGWIMESETTDTQYGSLALQFSKKNSVEYYPIGKINLSVLRNATDGDCDDKFGSWLGMYKGYQTIKVAGYQTRYSESTNTQQFGGGFTRRAYCVFAKDRAIGVGISIASNNKTELELMGIVTRTLSFDP